MTVSRVSLRHPVTGGVWECPAGAVGLWRGKGWRPANEPIETSVAPGDGDDEATPVDGDTEPARTGRNPKGSK